MIIGITGKNASGKTEVANFFREKGFSYYSLSDVVREEAKKKKLEPTRQNLINLGVELRKNLGNGATAILLKDKLKGNVVVDSVRSIGEIEELRKSGNFFLIGIDASVELRFKRAKARGRIGDGISLEEFKSLEKKEEDNKEGQQLNNCLKLADAVLINEGNLLQLKEKLNKLWQNLSK